jgi:hypothetical protein
MNFEAATGQRRPFFHAQEAQTGSEDRPLSNRGDLKSDSIIAHTKAELAIHLLELDVDHPGLGVADDIRERFLSDAEARRFDQCLKARCHQLYLDLELEPSEGGLAMGVPAESGFQAQVIQHRWPQVQRKVMDLPEDALDRLDTLFEAARQGALVGRLQGGLEVHLGEHEALTDFIVEFQGNVAAFAFLRFEEFVGEVLKLMAGAFAFAFAFLEHFGHLVVGARELAQFIMSMIEPAAGS